MSIRGRSNRLTNKINFDECKLPIYPSSYSINPV